MHTLPHSNGEMSRRTVYQQGHCNIYVLCRASRWVPMVEQSAKEKDVPVPFPETDGPVADAAQCTYAATGARTRR
jgi:hypothetical protein